MKAIDDILFDSGLFGSNDSFNGGISQEVLNSVGGGGGGVSTGGGSSVLITNTPGTPLSNETYVIRVESDKVDASILINGENTFKTAPNTVNINLSDILNGGDKIITVEKSGYKSPDKYIVTLVQNSDYNLNLNFNINPASSIFGGMGGNFGVSGLAMYNSLPSFDSNNPIYSNTPYYKLNIKHFYNEFEQPYDDSNDKIKNISFRLETNNVMPIEDINVVQSTTISLEGSDNSAIAIISDDSSIKETISLKSGVNNIVAAAGSFITIRTSNISSYRVKTIQIQSATFETKTISAASDTETVSTKLTLDGTQFDVSVSTEVFETIDANTAVISLIDTEKKEYNINSKADVPIGILKSTSTTAVELRINSIVYNFNNLGDGDKAVILIPSKVFTVIGNYKVILTPKQARTSRVSLTNQTDGNPIEFTINVVDAVYVGVPDIRNIQYPSLIKGPDFIGANVDFIISYESVNTDYVKIYKVGSSTFIRAGASGEVSLNFLQLLSLDGTQTSQSDDLVSLVLKLVPYNEQGRQVVIGKEEFITIQLDKGDITIPRDVAISRLADGFISQFDDKIFDDESSKYLTHLLHLGQGDNKVITTWVGSDSSLILKLYEPLPTSVQPNQQVWISKVQSNPIVETITINGLDTSYCPPLKGPNFTLEESNGVGYQIFDELIASGSETSTNLINKYLQGKSIDTTVLNIEYVSGSTYMFDNFSHFGSAEERVNNFFYKINLLEDYKAKYEGLTTTYNPEYSEGEGGILAEAYDDHIDLTLDGAQIITQDGIFDIQWERAQFTSVAKADEAKKVLETINGLIRSLDGFESFLYKSTNDLAYPKEMYVHPITGLGTFILRQTNHSEVIAWYGSLIDLSVEYDKYNPNYLVNNIPEFIREDYNNNDFLVFLDMIGQHFDIVWAYIANLSKTKNLEHKQVKGLSNKLVSNLLQSFGWNPKKAFNSPFLWEYAFGQYKDGFQKYSMSLADANDEVWRRILNNLPYLLKHKGTARAMKAIMACYGVPQSMLTIMEFGGPQDPTAGGVSKFTFDDRTAAIYLKGDLNSNGSSNVKVPWHVVGSTGDYPNSIEFRVLPSEIPSPKYSLISGSEWSLDLVQTTGSLGRIELNFGGDQSTSTYFEVTSSGNEYITSSIEYVLGPDWKTNSLDFPISTEYYSNVAINRHNNPDSSSWFEVWLATSNGSRIITSVSMSIATVDTQWETGSHLQIGGNGYDGNVDEFRLWTVPLQRSKFENHTLFPDAINGNDFDSSTKDLMFRLDFEYPKDRTITENKGIKNVAISDNYGDPFASASNMYSASTYPYQYTPYDRTVTANVPSLGFNVSNKIRFETQTLTTDLSYKQRATKKSFDRAPVDSNRLGLFFSPIKELNMDILKAFGDFNIDNYIGDPADEYKNSYKQLDILRGYYFERLDNRDIYEYIRLVKYIDKSLFEVLAELAPARTNISKGLLIEPHYLERSKTRWNKPESLRNDFTTLINTQDDIYVESESIPKDAYLDIQNVAKLDTTISNNNGIINLEETTVEVSNPNYETSIKLDNQTLEANAPMYSVAIQVPTGSSLTGEVDAFTFTEIGMDKNSLANRGYGLYAKHGVAKTYKFDEVFGNHTSSRENVFIVKEQYTQKINTQIAGYPTTRSLIYPGERVKYVKVPTTKYKYKVSTMAWSGSVTVGNEVVEVQALNGYLPTHYKFVNNLSEGLKRSYFMGSQQTALTTPDGLSAVETFTTNPNILRVAKTGRGSGEPILEVD
jgi:hypothetical protein